MRTGKKRTGTAGILLLLILLFWGNAAAISVRAVDLEDMVGSANRIFLGKVVGASTFYDSRISCDVTIYTMAVLEGIFGTSKGETITFRQVGNQYGRNNQVIGIPVYRKGEDVLLFLHGDSRHGLTSPVGLHQGVFHPVGRDNGKKVYMNRSGNRNLKLESYSSYRTVPRASVAMSGESVSPVDLEVLRDCIRQARNRTRGPK